MEEEKEKFLKEFGKDYGYPNASKSIEEIRATEFKRLDGLVYLDHAGATLYSELQMEEVMKDLTSNVYGNPHSQGDMCSATSDCVEAARQLVLDYCNASSKDYKCIFTAGATAALKLVGEAFPWSSDSCFMYTMENHNSVLGIREYALGKKAAAFAIDIEEFEYRNGLSRSDASSIKISKRPVQRRNDMRSREEGEACQGNAYNLFAFPSECNFSGMKFSLDLVNIIKNDSERVLEGLPFCRGKWMVLIDAAKGCATQPPDLTKFPADFVVISFYKIFGYPTGLGALVVRAEAADLLKKTYFSGGTVAASIADIDFVRRRKGIEASFEDGSQSFLSIASIRHGFKIVNNLTVSAIVKHTTSLTTYVRNKLLTLKHGNGTGICILYGGDTQKMSSHKFGPTIAFNLIRQDGSWFGYREVEKLASLSGIQLRTGCFCNPGACSKQLGLSHLDLLSNVEAGHVCWDDNDILHGKPTGAVRISFGYMSTYEDAEKFVSFVINSFVSMPSLATNGRLSEINNTFSSSRGIYLKSITVYPIKSCAGFSVDSWPLSSAGLQHDREWLLKSTSGEILTQKKAPEMCLVSTFIDLTQGILVVESPRCEMKLKIILEKDPYYGKKQNVELRSKRYGVLIYDNEVNIWLSNAIGRPCNLIRSCAPENQSYANRKEIVDKDMENKLNFVNEAQFLLISEGSVSDLNNRLRSNEHKSQCVQPIDSLRFRPNLVISGAEPYAEDHWRTLNIGTEKFTSLGGCNRCQMINLDQRTGQATTLKEPLATLASFRRVKGKILFGVLLRYDNADKVGRLKDGEKLLLQVGQRVYQTG
ncbi:hypothetical protein GIB67_031942 [Kingdonia uniflora]|uniref:Molybdenum cofactor sulfurase n=1 Tax=Kingdonia uniflora TaxID=39325 RepID=A0A7J7NU87_9MAGN|nr:hypothetical protein GIB67_031942 [Kingdonia uniflora]